MRLFLFIIFFTVSLFGNAVNTNITEASAQIVLDDEFDDEFSEDEEILSKSDPLEGYNRVMTDVNDYFYINILTPVATGYSNVIPKGARVGISNIFNNLFFPIRFVNNILQFKFENAFEESGRFVINSTIGILGIFDVAHEHFKFEEHNEDFGQTLGFYGVGAGPHIVLPFFGPSNLRDAISMIPDSMITSIYDTDIKSSEVFIMNGVYYLNKTSLHLGEYESIKKDAIDLYPFLRDLYEQKRISEIKE